MAEGLDALSFLVGHWRSCGPDGDTSAERCTEELWTAAAGGLMLGLNRDYRVGGSAFFEYLRIEQRGDKLVYVASPRGSGATDFTLVASDHSSARFENPDHDWPQRLVYRRTDDRLDVTASGLDPSARVLRFSLSSVED